MILHILCTQKWAAGYNPPLRSGRRTERDVFVNCMRFGGRYFIGIALLVGFHIIQSSNMAAGHSPPLRFGRHTKRRCVYKLYEVFVERYFIGTALLVKIHILYTQKWARGHRCSLRHNVCHRACECMKLENVSAWGKSGGNIFGGRYFIATTLLVGLYKI